MSESLTAFSINDWLEQIVHGVGGHDDYERYELVVYEDRDRGLADFVLRCLANPKCEGSDKVLAEIMRRRYAP